MSDIFNFSAGAAETARMTIKLPNDEPLTDQDGKEAFIDFRSPTGDEARKFDLKVRADRMNRAFKKQRQKKDLDVVTPEEVALTDAESSRKVAALAAGWYLVNPKDRSPADFPFSPENAQRMFEHPGNALILQQAHIFLASLENFMPSSSKS